MKYVKMLALAAVAAGALMAFIGAGTASASVLCSTTTDPCTSPWANQTLNMTKTSGTSLLLVNTANETEDTCTGGGSKGTLTNGTSTATATVSVAKEGQTWNECTFTKKTLEGGTLEVHKIAGTSNGTVTGSGFKVTFLAFGITSCVYETGEGRDLGTLTEGNPAVFHVEAAVLKVSGVGCPTSSKWTATYTVTEPSNTTLSVAAS